MKRATLIKSITELIYNIFRIEEYLTSSDEESKKVEMSKYIKRGRNFICYKIEDGYHFAPSRFIGYKDNTLRKHENNRLDHKVDGRETDKVLNGLFKKKCKADEEIENMYRKYCEDLRVEPEDRIHKFWIHTGEIAFDKTYREGD